MSVRSIRSWAIVSAVALAASGTPAGLMRVAVAAPRPAKLDVPSAPVKTEPTSAFGPWGDFVPPTPADLVVRQPNGLALSTHLAPAEVGGNLELNGYTIVKGADGWWRYASGHTKTGVQVSGARAGIDAVPDGVQRGSGRAKDIWSDGKGGDVRTQVFRMLQLASRQAQAKAAAEGQPRVFRFPVLMLATWWDTSKGQTSPQFQKGTDTTEYIKNILDGFGGNPHGSLTEYYFENSFGQFLVKIDVYGPFVSQRSRQDRCYYGGIDAPPSQTDDLDPLDALGPGGLGAAGMAVEAVPQADPTVDFSQYDNDGDGYVDFMGIVHSGADMAVTSDPCNTWSHALPISSLGEIALGLAGLPADTLRLGLPTLDGVLIDRVFTMPEFDEIGSRLPIGVASHEMAHALGEPDYYAVNGTSQGDGEWDIMSGGAYLGTPDGTNPSGFNPATRVFQGWVTPTIVHDDTRNVTLHPRLLKPAAGYTVGQPDPNLLLVPVKWIKPGQKDELGHVWTDKDVYGLAKDGDNGYVLEGYYLEDWNRFASAPAIHPGMTRNGYFDKGIHGSGLLVWHFDYFARSNVLPGYANNGQDDANRLQMDVVEWDQNDNTQELQLNYNRAEPTDVVFGAAAGITSGMHLEEPGRPVVAGDPQKALSFSGTLIPFTTDNHDFTVDNNPANYTMTVTAGGTGDCTLQLLYNGKPFGGKADSGSVGDVETITVTKPKAGKWTAQVGDFAACLNYTGAITFSKPGYSSMGAGDTWSNWTQKPTGWAFTNVGPSEAEGLDDSSDTPGSSTVTLDILHIGTDRVDIAPGFVTAPQTALGGALGFNAGQDNAMTVPVFNNGGKASGPVRVEVHDGSPTGALISAGTVDLGAYQRGAYSFTWKPAAEGAYDLYTVVDPNHALDEADENNNVQKSTAFVGPALAKVLVVDADSLRDGEEEVTGALSLLGVPYTIVKSHVDAATMAKYQAVVWEAGVNRGNGQFTDADVTAIQTYLDGGGKVLLTSNRATDALAAISQAAIATNYFGVTVAGTPDTFVDPVEGVATGGVLGSRTLTIQPYPTRPFIDPLKLAKSTKGTAVELLKLAKSGKPNQDGALLGAAVTGDAAHHGFKTAVLSFNMMQITQPADAVGVMRSLLGFFGVATGTYRPAPAHPVIFHPTVRNAAAGRETPIGAMVIGAPANAVATLHYRRHGQGDYYSVAMAAGAEPGTWLATIPGKAFTPDGVDYYLDVAGVFDPRPAKVDALAHAIEVNPPELAAPLGILHASGPPQLPVVAGATAARRLPATGGNVVWGWVGIGLLSFVVALRRRRRAINSAS